MAVCPACSSSDHVVRMSPCSSTRSIFYCSTCAVEFADFDATIRATTGSMRA